MLLGDKVIYIDTNVLVYIQNKKSQYYESSQKIFYSLLKENKICLNQLVLWEFFSIITNPSKVEAPWTTSKARDYINYLAQSVGNIHIITNEIFYNAISSAEKHNIKKYEIYDHILAQTMLFYGIEELVTVNESDFKKYDFIKNIIIPEKNVKNKQNPKATINYGKQWLDDNDIQNVVEVLKSDFLTQGPKVKKFEKALCDYTGAKYCVAVANGTAALHIAVAALEIEKGKKGITSPITFVASSNSMIYNGLIPDFADIKPDTYNVNTNEIKKRVDNNTKLVIPVHFAGQPCDMKKIKNIADDKDLFVIEDAAHAIGSEYEDGSKVGSCKYSEMTTFSFHPVKTMTTGEGGAITTNSGELYEKLLLLRSHGITKDKEKLAKNPGPWYHEMQDIGFNYRLTDIQSALGISQLKKLDDFIKKRREIVEIYNNAFRNIEWLKTPYEKPEVNSAFHLYVLQFDFEKIGKTRSQVMNELREKNIGTQVHYIPVHTQPYYKANYGFKQGDFPVSEKYYENALSIPLYPKMSDEDVEYVIGNILELDN